MVAPTDSDAGLDSHRLREKGFHKRRDVEQAVKNAHCNRVSTHPLSQATGHR